MPELSSVADERQALRRRMRSLRRGISEQARLEKETALAQHIRALGVYKAAHRIAIFLAFDGEPRLQQLLNTAIGQGKQLFAPVIRADSMHFAALTPDTNMGANSFGILEPTDSELVDVRSLDLVLTPLVAFDDRGTRLGVGRAYYDRCFRSLRHRQQWFRPKLLGIAYGFQQLPFIEPLTWDIPLWAVVTENGLQQFSCKKP